MVIITGDVVDQNGTPRPEGFAGIVPKLLGDGTATAVTIDLTALPFNMNFKRVLPVRVTAPFDNTVTLTLNGTLVTIQYPNPIPTTGTQILLLLWYTPAA